MILLAAALALTGVVCAALFAWDLHVRYGPVCTGNARWRREAPLRAQRAEEREVLAALTPDDRAWLEARGWAP